MSPQHFHRHYAPLKRPPHRSGNPYFRSRAADRVAMSRVKNTASRLPFKFWVYLFTIILVLCGTGWALFFSPFFIISQVDVTGTDEVRAREVEDMLWQQTDESRFYALSQNRLPLFDSSNLQSRILERYNLEKVNIRKKLPNSITIELTEKKPVAVWFEMDTYYIVDEQGYMLRIIPGAIADLPIIYNNAHPQYNEQSKQFYNQSGVIAMARDIQSQLESSLSFLNVYQMTVTQEKNTLTLILKDGPLIYLSTGQPLMTQVEHLTTLHNTELKNQWSKLDYVDLRFGDKLYYK